MDSSQSNRNGNFMSSNNNTVEVQLVTLENGVIRYIQMLRLPYGAVPLKGTKFNTKFSKFGVFKNSEYLVEDVITDYVEKKANDGYDNWSSSELFVKLVLKLLSCETNEPAPVVPQVKAKPARKSSKKSPEPT